MYSFLKKNNYLLTIMATFIMLAIILFTIYLGLNEKHEISIETKAFKKEWETFNEKYDASHNILKSLAIDEKINIKYLDPGDALDFIYNDTGLIFVGTPDDQTSRIAIETLIETALNHGLKDIYYIDITKYQTDWVIYDGALKDYVYDEKYDDLLIALDDYLGVENYKLYDGDIEYDTNTKRINLPNVFAVRKGNLVGNYRGIGTKEEGYVENLSTTEKERLVDNYEELILLTKNHNV